MINILNLNPSIDYFLFCEEFEMNKTNHSKSESVNVGGKGSNVGIVLNNLRVNSIIHGFVGGFTGTYVASEIEKYQYIKNEMIDTGQLTRINVKLNYKGETEVNGVGKIIPNVYIKQLEKSLERLNEKDILIMTGRIANGMSFDWYLKMAKQMNRQKTEFVLDINDSILKDILKFKPLLIKPNEEEIKNIFNHQGELSRTDLIKYGKYMLKAGAKHVIISLGSKGSLFFVEDRVFKSDNLQKTVKNTVGAGDSMIAGFIAEYAISKDPLKAYKKGQACGNATAFSKEIADFDMIEKILKQIEIEEITNEN